MNQEERDWLEWLKRVEDGVVTQQQAAEKMGVSDRWVRELLTRMKTDGDAVVVHGLNGKTLLVNQARPQLHRTGKQKQGQNPLPTREAEKPDSCT
jgi:predicted DNA-binding protein (UPF0251 family)